VGLELFDHEAANRVAQLIMFVGEDEVLTPGGEVGLEDVCSGHGPDATGAILQSKQ